MKYYKLLNEVYAFEEDGSQDEYISPHMIRMSDDEFDRYVNPDNYLTDSEKYAKYLNQLRPLSRKQFKLALLDKDLLDNLEQKISEITDPTERKRITIEYSESTEFTRTSESVKTMFALIEQSEEDINKLWEKALAL